MNQKILHTPEGLRDIYSDECERKQILEQRLHQVPASYGYRDIETPSIEFFDVFGSDIGTIPSRDLFKFFDREGNTLVLRPDFTPSIARAASRYFQNVDHPIRLCYIGKSFVNYSGLQGRLKENTQMGAELIGASGADADAEVIAMATETMLAAGLGEFQISVGHVAFFESLAEEAGFDEDTVLRLRNLIHNRNTFGVEKLLSSLEEERKSASQPLDERIRRLLIALPTLTGGEELLEKAFSMSEGLKAQEAVVRLKKVLELLKLYGLERYTSFDLGMLSVYMYYTGIIFRGYTYGTGEAVVKGGRYDALLKHFGKDLPSIGFVVVIGQLLNALQRQKIEILPAHERYLILYREEAAKEAVSRAAAWRRQGKYTELMLLASEKDIEKSDEEYRREGGYAGVIRL
jgi:ATP phosphoribosyltransferase regulatory subunit